MDFRKLHERFKDADSPSPELQIKWLRKNGFPDHIIDQTMISVYTDIEQGKVFENGAELNRCLRDTARKIHTEELSVYINKLQEFEAKMKNKWEIERKKKLPWYKRIFK